METQMETTTPAELAIGLDELRADQQAAGYPQRPERKATKTERASLVGATLYRARKNRRGFRSDPDHREVVDLQRVEVIEAGPTWAQISDLDYTTGQASRVYTLHLIESLERGGLSSWHRTPDALMARGS
jgi:hypothetical protein